ncbi:MAG: NTP transferase domain-containing protein [Candidatus Heimdallarchaeota archaeon]|nr:NTP transferase domain-containing protein [Candidatus Heimdallarchaeota archaeon]
MAQCYQKAASDRCMEAIILAAGKGTRLLPLTENRPKHLLEIAGKPILKWQLDELLSLSKISKIIIVTNYKEEMIKEAVRRWTDDSRILFVHQEQTRGTGDAVLSALPFLIEDSSFLVINGDVMVVDAIKQMVECKDISAILGASVDHPELFGVLKEEDNILKDIIEKPPSAEDNALINAGLYKFPSESRNHFYELKDSQRGEREITDVVKKLLSSTSFKVLKTKHNWFDVGHPWQILDANEYFMDQFQHTFENLGTVEEGVYVLGSLHVGKGARVRSGVYIEGPVFIDEGADVGPNCYIRSRTYIGRNARVGNACEIKNSVIYKDTHAAHLSYLGDSVLGEYSNLGAGTITANLRHDGNNIRMTVKEVRQDTGRRKLGVIMGDNVKTGIGVSILPGVVIHGGARINVGDVISRDVLPD